MNAKQSKIAFLILFTILGFIALQIPFTKLVGSNVSFTLFDFFAPIAGVFLGPFVGIASVLTMELFNFLIKQEPVSTGGIIRLFPMLFAVYYFAVMSKKKEPNKWILAVPVLVIVLFLAHPIGRTVPYYPLFWLIPVVAFFKRDWLLARSLGATFTAHAVGGAAWIWAFNLPAPVWQSLIPIVIQERLLFTLGIAGSYLLVKQLLKLKITAKYFPHIKSLTPSA